MLSLGKKVDDPVKWNRDQVAWRTKAMLEDISIGCVSTWACEGCGHLVTDSICLCQKIFTCPGCGYEEKPIPIEYLDTKQMRVYTKEDWKIIDIEPEYYI